MNMREYGGMIREHRKRLRLSQQELADCLSLSRTTVSLIETGAPMDIGVRKLSRLCDRVGLCLQIIPRPTPVLADLLKANAARRADNLKNTSAILAGRSPKKSTEKSVRKSVKTTFADSHQQPGGGHA